VTGSGPGDGVISLSAGPAEVELVLSQIDSLPTLPVVASRIIELTTEEDSSTREVIQLIESDQSLTARVLSMVHRANIGTTVTTVDRAVIMLGFNTIRNLVLSIQIFETFSHCMEQSSSSFDRHGFWKHSLAVGCAARLLAEMKKGVSEPGAGSAPLPEDAFVCGLLHDIGKVIFDGCFPKSYDRVIRQVESDRCGIMDVEQRVFGIDHTLVGRRLADRWNLSEMIQESIWLHHHTPASTPTRIKYPDHVILVQLADRIARHMGIGYSGNYAEEDSLSELAESRGYTLKDFQDILSMLPDLIEARAEMIGLDQLTSKEVYQEALSKANLELMRVNRSLSETNRILETRSRCFDALRTLSSSVGDDPVHEDVCRSAVRSVGLVFPERQVSVLGCSEYRSIITIVFSPSKAVPGGLDVLPLSSVGGLDQLAGLGSCWLPFSRLPDLLQDRLTRLFGQRPSWYWCIWHQGRFLGAIVIDGSGPPSEDESFYALSDTLEVWLNAAESRSLTQQLTDELTEINRRLVVSQVEAARVGSLAMVGQMAGGAAHELNNPLTVISGTAQILDREEMDDEVRRSAQVISVHAHRASAIVSELMDFAKPTPPEASEWSLSKLLGEVRREWLKKNIFTEAGFILEISDDVYKVVADASQIKKLFDEVICNAVEAMREVTEKLLIINSRLDLTDEKVVVRIQDNGSGMSAEVLDRAMVPFFSYRSAGRGRGLGLSRACRYAEINGGKIRLTSELDKGTVVYVELPVVINR
jgi:signal transduction histidine kinase/HD-like signal output (HDOD) protein